MFLKFLLPIFPLTIPRKPKETLMKLNKTFIATALSLLARGTALADITIGVSLPATTA